jgi:hypothetical protein
MKSATTSSVSKSSYSSAASSSQKERTPFKTERNKHKYHSTYDTMDSLLNGSSSTSSSSSSTNSSKVKRSDILGSTSVDEYPSYSKLKSHDSGYFDGSYYKSKYEDLLSDVSNNRHTPKKVTMPYAGSSTTRQLKPYKRTDSTSNDSKHRTAINLYDLLDNDESSTSSQKQQPQTSTTQVNGSYRRQYSQRKSAGQSLRTAYNHDNNLSTTDDSSDSDFEKTERENRRKEIQSLIMKYAQLDDFYSKSSNLNGDSESKKKDNNNNSTKDPWDTKAQSPVVIPMKPSNSSKQQPSTSRASNGFNALGKSQTTANISHYQSNYDYNDLSWYGSNYSNSSKNKGSNVVPITTYAQKSSSKSRMSKALSTFVRIITLCNE